MLNHEPTLARSRKPRTTNSGQFHTQAAAHAEGAMEAIASCMVTRDLLSQCECEIHRDIVALLRTERAIHARVERIDAVILPEVQRCYNGA